MKRAIFITILTLCLVGKSFACLNGEMLILGDGSYLYDHPKNETPRGHDLGENSRAELQRIAKRLDGLYKIKKDIRYLSDEGLVLIVLGEYKKAIALYLEIEKIEPDRYSTASNIGTAYELDGQNKHALLWIEKAVKLNPKSHDGSEWIHVNILKAKLGGDKFINSDFLLNTSFGADSIPRTSLKPQEQYLLSDALYYQLNERNSFVKPKDKIVAQLLFDLGNLTFIIGDYKVALDDYALAKEYGYTDQLIDQRIKACAYQSTRSSKKYTPNIINEKRYRRIYIYAGLGGLLGILLAFKVLKKRSNRLLRLQCHDEQRARKVRGREEKTCSLCKAFIHTGSA